MTKQLARVAILITKRTRAIHSDSERERERVSCVVLVSQMRGVKSVKHVVSMYASTKKFGVGRLMVMSGVG